MALILRLKRALRRSAWLATVFQVFASLETSMRYAVASRSSKARPLELRSRLQTTRLISCGCAKSNCTQPVFSFAIQLRLLP